MTVVILCQPTAIPEFRRRDHDMKYLSDLGDLSVRCLAQHADGSPWTLAGAAAISLFLATFCWVFCGKAMRMRNGRFRLKASHHLICGLAAMATVISGVLFSSSGFIQSAALSMVCEWRERMAADRGWQATVFAHVFGLVHRTGRERSGQVTPLANGGKVIPDHHPETRHLIASTWGKKSAERFIEDHALLAVISPIPLEDVANAVRGDYARFRQECGPEKPYEFAKRAVRVVAEKISCRLEFGTACLGRQVQMAVTGTVLLLQGIAYAAAAWSACRDLKVQT